MGKQQKLKEQRRIERQVEEVVSTRKNKVWLISVFVILAVAAASVWGYVYFKTSKDKKTNEEAPVTASEHPVVTIETDKGNIVVELDRAAAPKTVDNFVKLTKDGFYDGTKFHRVIADFVAQGGDPLSKTDDEAVGSGGPGYEFEDEINAKSLGLSDDVIKSYEAQGYKYNESLTSHKMEAGVIAMANSGPGTNGSQFFIVLNKPQPHLDGKHTVFGKVTQGMDVVGKIAQGDVMKKVTVQE